MTRYLVHVLLLFLLNLSHPVGVAAAIKTETINVGYVGLVGATRTVFVLRLELPWTDCGGGQKARSARHTAPQTETLFVWEGVAEQFGFGLLLSCHIPIPVPVPIREEFWCPCNRCALAASWPLRKAHVPDSLAVIL